MANEVTPLYRGGNPDLTAQATAAVTGGRFVSISATIQSGPGLTTEASGGNLRVAHTAAAAAAFGVSAADAASGAKLAVIMPGSIVPMIAGANITAGVGVEADAAAKPITLASGIRVGTAVTTATSGNEVFVRIGA